jgi:hypothetical protein
MIALGVLILVVVAAASLGVFFRGGETIHIDLHWFTIKTTAGIVFLAGAIALALAVFALSLIWEGLKRSRRRRKETKELRHRAAANEQSGAAATGQTPSGSPGGAAPTAVPRSTGPDDHFDSAPRDR